MSFHTKPNFILFIIKGLKVSRQSWKARQGGPEAVTVLVLGQNPTPFQAMESKRCLSLFGVTNLVDLGFLSLKS